MAREIIEYTPGPVSTEFHNDTDSRVKLLIGPFGTGKSTSCCWDMFDFMSRRVKPSPVDGVRRSRFAVVRKFYRQLNDTTIRTFLDWFPEAYFGTYLKSSNIYKMRIEDHTGVREIEILFRALERPEDTDNLLSLELTGAFFDEAREMHEEVITVMLGRIKRYPSRRSFNGENPYETIPQIVLASNYPDINNWLYDKFVANPVDGYTMYRQGQEENAHNLADGYYEDLEKDYAHRPDLLRTLVRGDWGVTVRGSAVYNGFNRDIHVARKTLKPIQGVGTVYRGWDNTGLNPACVIAQLSPTGQLVILHEMWHPDMAITDFTESVLLYCNRRFSKDTEYVDIADPAGKHRGPLKISPATYQKRMGVRMKDGIQNFDIRRDSVQRLLSRLINGEPAIIIDPSCRMITEGFDGGYAFSEIGGSGEFRETPEKNQYSHIADALQYLCTFLFSLRNNKKSEKKTGFLKRKRDIGKDDWLS